MTNLFFIIHCLPFINIKLIDFFSKLPLEIKIIWLLAVFFLTLFSIFFVTLIASRIIKNYKSRKTAIIKEKIQKPILFFLFDESMQNISSHKEKMKVIELFGKEILKNTFNRNILRKAIINLHTNYSGEFAYKLEHLFLILGLNKDVKKRLKSNRWHIKASAIKEIAQMNIRKYPEYILRLINHPNANVRTEALVASVKLNRKKPFAFFENLKFTMSDWDQIRMHEALLFYETAEIPLMGKWLGSPNESIVVFSLKIIGYYDHENETEQVRECLNNPSEKIKLQAVKTLGELSSKESLLALFESLQKEKENKKIFLQILQSLTLIGIYDSDVDKIKKFLETTDYDIIFESCLTLKSAPKGSEILKKIISEADESVVDIMKYALNYTN